MVIRKFEYLKSFENDLKLQLSVDKKYLPISKKLVVLLREINPYLAKIEENQHPYFFVLNTNANNSANLTDNNINLLKKILLQQGFLKGTR